MFSEDLSEWYWHTACVVGSTVVKSCRYLVQLASEGQRNDVLCLLALEVLLLGILGLLLELRVLLDLLRDDVLDDA